MNADAIHHEINCKVTSQTDPNIPTNEAKPKALGVPNLIVPMKTTTQNPNNKNGQKNPLVTCSAQLDKQYNAPSQSSNISDGKTWVVLIGIMLSPS